MGVSEVSIIYIYIDKVGDFLVIDASTTSTALGFLPECVMKVKMEPRDFLFGMMELLDPFIYFFGVVYQRYGKA